MYIIIETNLHIWIIRTFAESSSDRGGSIPLASGAHGVHWAGDIPRSGKYYLFKVISMNISYIKCPTLNVGLLQLRSHSQPMERH